MTETLIWLVTFALILFLCLQVWEKGLKQFLDRALPEPLRPGSDDQWIWGPAFAVLGATFVVRPIDMLLSLITLAIVGWIVKLVLSWAMKRVKLH